MKGIELRFKDAELRANADATMTVSGYVNKTGQLSEVLGGAKRFVEKIAKGAFSKAISNAQRDIDFLAEHDSKQILSSTRNNSLQLKEDDQGLYMEATIAPTSYGKDYYELIKSGIHRNMSFGFRTVRDSWKSLGNGLFERTIEELELFEVSVVRDPAYSQSTIAARGINVVEEVEVPASVQIKKLEHSDKKEKTNMKTEHRYGQRKEDIKAEQRNADYAEFKSILTEERTLQLTGQASSVIPENVADLIVKKMEDTAPVFARVKKFSSVPGRLSIPRESFAFDAGFVGEGQNIVEGAIALGDVKLEQKRYGAVVSLSNQLINDAAINMVDYVAELLGRRVAKAAEKSILVGNTADEFRGIIHDADVQAKAVTVNTLNDLTVDQLLDLYNSVPPEALTGSAYIMSKTAFNKVSRLRDGNGHFYVQNGVVNGKPTRTLFGAEIFVSDSLPDTTPIVFGNLEMGYALMIKQAQGLQVIQDTENSLRGSKMFLLDVYADGAVYNPDALAVLNVTA
ncbi:phage major capsid protein [Fictibacillus enclensis]|uniref:phage major capsid protein n=1 Tax=Fictibacillus enclensis TaxID=1017270 RepID=UPI0025A0BB6B|nr:phage major capsid protein [Fictibacillus enclensis]MDM5197587.1 phage major capsid protein [Fictibacillus enclensis]